MKVSIGAGLLVLATASFSPVMGSPKPGKILCIGDSLTFGVGGNGVTWPQTLASLSGVETVNRGQPGWIPRHLKYLFFLQDCPFLTRMQVEGIPEKEAEKRKHQPDINNVREFLKPGQTILVQDGAVRISYVWENPYAGADANTIPAAGVTAGRWVKKTGVNHVSPPSLPEFCVLWMGANGMEADDLSQSLREITGELNDNKVPFLILGLVNRQPPNAASSAITDWGKWINECNARLRSEYPGKMLDLQAWFTSSGEFQGGGFQTKKWLPEAGDLQVSEDLSDQNLGIVPRSLRAPDNFTHLNSMGYKIVGTLVYERLKSGGQL